MDKADWGKIGAIGGIIGGIASSIAAVTAIIIEWDELQKRISLIVFLIIIAVIIIIIGNNLNIFMVFSL